MTCVKLYNDTTSIFKNSSDKDFIIIDEISSGFGAFGAIVVCLLGTAANAFTLFVILTRPKVKTQTLSPLIFFLSLCYFFFSILFLPLVAMRYIHQDGIKDVIGMCSSMVTVVEYHSEADEIQ